MNYYQKDVTVSGTDVPDHISLIIPFTGCPVNCPGCASPYLQDATQGEPFSTDILKKLILKNRGVIDCVCFFGGEWEEDKLLEYVRYIRYFFEELKIALYTGRQMNSISREIRDNFDFLKVGPYIDRFGPLNHNSTNQQFYDLKLNKEITNKFHR